MFQDIGNFPAVDIKQGGFNSWNCRQAITLGAKNAKHIMSYIYRMHRTN